MEALIATSENRLLEAQDQLNKVLQENEALKESEGTLEALKGSLQEARNEVEQLFSAVKILIRGLRPFRVRVKDLVVQKMFLKKQLQSLELLQREVFELVRSMTSDMRLETPRRAASFRGWHTCTLFFFFHLSFFLSLTTRLFYWDNKLGQLW
jgi:chromosome segregation ATPase